MKLRDALHDVFGKNCDQPQDVTIGLMPRGKPKIGNCIFIGPTAINLSGTTAGDGAGAVVTQPNHLLATVMGIPARIISFRRF